MSTMVPYRSNNQHFGFGGRYSLFIQLCRLLSIVPLRPKFCLKIDYPWLSQSTTG